MNGEIPDRIHWEGRVRTCQEQLSEWKTGGLQTGISRHVRLCNCLPTQDSQRGTGLGSGERERERETETETETGWEEEKREQSEEQKKDKGKRLLCCHPHRREKASDILKTHTERRPFKDFMKYQLPQQR